MESDLEKVPSLEDASLAQPDKDFTPPEDKVNNQPTFNPEELHKERLEEKFMEDIKTGYTIEKLARIVERYGKDNGIPDMQIQASKIRNGALPETITREFGIRNQYEILVKEMLANSPKHTINKIKKSL